MRTTAGRRGQLRHHHLQRCLRSVEGRHRAGFRYTFDCDGTNDLAASYRRGRRADNTTCTFNDNGSYTVFGRTFDKDDGYTQYSTVVTVNNVAPQNVNGGNDQTVNEGDWSA